MDDVSCLGNLGAAKWWRRPRLLLPGRAFCCPAAGGVQPPATTQCRARVRRSPDADVDWSKGRYEGTARDGGPGRRLKHHVCPPTLTSTDPEFPSRSTAMTPPPARPPPWAMTAWTTRRRTTTQGANGRAVAVRPLRADYPGPCPRAIAGTAGAYAAALVIRRRRRRRRRRRPHLPPPPTTPSRGHGSLPTLTTCPSTANLARPLVVLAAAVLCSLA